MLRSFLLLSCLAACTTFHSGTADTPDAAPDSPTPDAHFAVSRALAASGNYGSPGVGVVTRLDVETLMSTQNVAQGSALGDPILRQIGNRVYVVNRFGSNSITVLDAQTLSVLDQVSTGANSNPQDVAVVGSKLYVPALGTAGVLVIANGAVAGTINLATVLGDPDGKPDCASAYAVGTHVYVACGLLDTANFSVVRDAKVAVIDTANDSVVGSVVMPQKNPLGLFERAPANSIYANDLMIPTAPSFTLTEGCVARISTANPTMPTAACGPTNMSLGGLPNKIAFDAKQNKLYLAVTEAFPPNPVARVRVVDLQSGNVASTPLTPVSEQIVDVAVCPNSDVVVMDDTTNAGGLRVWRNGAERTTSPIAIGMPPNTNPTLVCYDAAP